MPFIHKQIHQQAQRSVNLQSAWVLTKCTLEDQTLNLLQQMHASVRFTTLTSYYRPENGNPTMLRETASVLLLISVWTANSL